MGGRVWVVTVALWGVVGCGDDGATRPDGADGAASGDAPGGGGDGAAGADGASDAVVTPANLVFVTSTKQMPGTLGGLTGADALCQTLAGAAGLPGTYVAWLSTDTVDARDRLGASRGWRRPDGRPFVDAQGDLINGRIFYPADVDETGAMVLAAGDVVATNTSGDGTASSAGDCGDFADPAAGGTTAGLPFGTTTAWTADAFTDCNVAARLYCFGTGLNVPVDVTPASGPRAFVDVRRWIPNSGGVPDADAACQNAATLAGLPGTFKALLGTSTASAASRFDLGGEPWVRTDGLRLAPSRTAFMAGALETALTVNAAGEPVIGEEYTWTGAAGTGLSLPTDVPSVSRTCADWTDPDGGIGGIGWFHLAHPLFWDRGGSGGFNCIVDGAVYAPMLYCLEE